jgi:hypothetical protein
MLASSLLMSVALVPASLSAKDFSDVTEDGLVRVPSNRKAGVYRAPDVGFAHYRRIMLVPASVTFKKNWDRMNPGLKPSERERIGDDLVRFFHEELVAELVERGGFALAESPAPDVLRIDPSIVNLDITAPDAGSTPGTRSFARTAGSMTLIVELRDAASGVIVGRVIDHEQAREFHDLQLVNQVTNAEEARVAFANAARYTRSAINVAKTDRN